MPVGKPAQPDRLRRAWNWLYCLLNGHYWDKAAEIEITEKMRYEFRFTCRWCGATGSDKRW